MGIKETVVSSLTDIKNWGELHSPELLLGAGIVGIIGGTVLACRATTKLDDILDESKASMDQIHNVLEDPKKYIAEDAVYTEQDAKRDKTLVMTKTALKIARNYAPAIIIEVAGIACICGSYGILRKREAATAALLSATETAFAKYRERVKDRYGDEAEKDIFYNRSYEKVTEVNPETGKKEKKTKVVCGENPGDPYTFIFDEAHFKSAVGNGQDRLTYLWSVEKAFNRLLHDRAAESKHHRAYIWLDKMLDEMGYIWDDEREDEQRAKYHLCGCFYDENDPTADNCVDFNLGENNVAVVNGTEDVCIFTVNCCGNLWKKMADIAERN